MGKRQIRIFEKEVPEKLKDLLAIEINLILKNDITLHGKILKTEGKFLQFKDSILRKHKILIEDIAEIIVDKIAP